MINGKDRRKWEQIIGRMAGAAGSSLPSVSEIAEDSENPFQILISTIISLRTKDQVTLQASRRLFEQAGSAEEMVSLPAETIASLIFPAGFYRTKAKTIREISRILLEDYQGNVPSDEADLLALPGVGRKTANLVRGLAFSIPAICVDTHVHRIANRCGWVRTRTPEQTEFALMEVLPERFWIGINGLLVLYGQQVCTPLSPYCSRCPLQSDCPRRGVEKSR